MPEVVLLLKVGPETRLGAQGVGEAQCHFSGDRGTAVEQAGRYGGCMIRRSGTLDWRSQLVDDLYFRE